MNAVEIVEHDFYGQQVSLVERGDDSYVLLDQLCSHMGIDREPQRKNLSRQVWAQGMTSVMEVMLSGENRAYPRTVLNVKILGMWLANITTSRIKDDHARQMVERYQVELTQKIHEWLSSPPQMALSEDEIVHQALAITAARVEALKAEVRELTPRAESWDQLADASGTYTVSDAGKLLASAGCATGPRRLFQQLKDMGWIFKRSGIWTGYQTKIDAGLLAEYAGSHFHPRTGERVLDAPTVRVTIAGLDALRQIFGGLEAFAGFEEMAA